MLKGTAAARAQPSASGAVPGGYSLSRIGALRSLICVTFLSLVPLQMSCRRAPRPRCSSRLSFGGSVFAWRREAAQRELARAQGHPDARSRHTPPSRWAPRHPQALPAFSRGSLPDGVTRLPRRPCCCSTGEAETPSCLHPRCSSVTATCKVPCSPPKPGWSRRHFMQGKATCSPFQVQTLLQGKLRHGPRVA